MGLKIGIDQDSIITDFTTQFINYVEQAEFEIDYEKIYNEYYLETAIKGFSHEQQESIMDEIMAVPNFWLTMKPINHAINYVRWLKNWYEIFIVTAPCKFEQMYYDTKIAWLNEYIPEINNDHIIFSKRKWEEDIDIIIDDKPNTLIKCKEQGIITITLDYKYNRNVDVDYRMSNWKLIPSIMKDINNKISTGVYFGSNS